MQNNDIVKQIKSLLLILFKRDLSFQIVYEKYSSSRFFKFKTKIKLRFAIEKPKLFRSKA